MTRDEFIAFCDEQYNLITGISRTKGVDYAGDEDALRNFKDAGKELGMSASKVWGVYAHKHWSAIMAFVKNGKVESEPIEGRLHDIILYSFLLLAMVKEHKEAQKPPVPRASDMARGMTEEDLKRRGL